jgi:hypothetical protein
LTGTGGSGARDQLFKIHNGKVDGDNVTFDVEGDHGGLHVSLKFVDKHLKGEAGDQAGSVTSAAALELARADQTLLQRLNSRAAGNHKPVNDCVEEASRQWLERGHRGRSLPPRGTVETDTHD